jgi:Calcineurin-like phosphoesterase
MARPRRTRHSPRRTKQASCAPTKPCSIPTPTRVGTPGATHASPRRLAELPPGTQTLLLSHFPLTREPTRALKYPEFAQWCGTERTADWHLRYGARAVIYGHLHIPRTTWQDGVRFDEVSLGYPEELDLNPDRPRALRQILPATPAHYAAGTTSGITENS